MNVALPKQIQEQLEQAESIQKALVEQATGAGETVEQTPEPQQVVESPAQAEPVVEQPQVQAPAEDVVLAEKYRTLEGKYRAEVPRLLQQNRELQHQLDAMNSKLEELSKQKPEPAAVQPQDSDKDVEEYGADLVDMVMRQALVVFRREADALVKELRKDLAALQTQTQTVTEKVIESEEDKFWNRVRELVSDWDAVDADPSWVTFLGSTPEFSDEPYRYSAIRAVEAGKPEKIAKLVKLWRGDKPKTEPTTEPAKPTAQEELSRQVAPAKTGTASVPASAAGKIYTGADYSYWNDPRRAKDTDAETVESMMRELEQAYAENRIRW